MSDDHAHPDAACGDAGAALAAAKATCAQRGVQLTAVRQSVLEVLTEARRPMGAYDVLEALEQRLGRRLAPPTVYRALDFLLEQRFISRIESRNAFVSCAHPDHPHACVFFICERCGASAEIESPALETLINRDAAALGFRVGKPMVELQGTCARCLAAA